jgi:hypothetical protein
MEDIDYDKKQASNPRANYNFNFSSQISLIIELLFSAGIYIWFSVVMICNAIQILRNNRPASTPAQKEEDVEVNAVAQTPSQVQPVPSATQSQKPA